MENLGLKPGGEPTVDRLRIIVQRAVLALQVGARIEVEAAAVVCEREQAVKLARAKVARATLDAVRVRAVFDRFCFLLFALFVTCFAYSLALLEMYYVSAFLIFSKFSVS